MTPAINRTENVQYIKSSFFTPSRIDKVDYGTDPIERGMCNANIEDLLAGVSVVFALLAFGLAGLETRLLKSLAVLGEQIRQVCHCKHRGLRMLHRRGTVTLFCCFQHGLHPFLNGGLNQKPMNKCGFGLANPMHSSYGLQLVGGV